MQPLRQRTGLQADAGKWQVQAGEEGGERLRLAGDLGLADDLSRGIEMQTLLSSKDTSIPA
jgi:hypothetical protein